MLRDLVVKPRSRDPGNSAFQKAFPGGRLVMTGGKELALELEARGYDWIQKQAA